MALRTNLLKTIILVVACCGTVAAFADAKATPERTARADTPAAVAMRVQKLTREIARFERNQRDPAMRRHARRLRHAWSNYLRARRDADAAFAQRGITFGSDYYRLQHGLLDAQTAQIRQLRSHN